MFRGTGRCTWTAPFETKPLCNRAFTIPASSLNQHGELVYFTSPATAATNVITQHFGVVLALPIRDVVIVTDPQATIQRLVHHPGRDSGAHLARGRAECLT